MSIINWQGQKQQKQPYQSIDGSKLAKFMASRVVTATGTNKMETINWWRPK